jgi:hypothetical protein
LGGGLVFCEAHWSFLKRRGFHIGSRPAAKYTRLCQPPLTGVFGSLPDVPVDCNAGYLLAVARRAG